MAPDSFSGDLSALADFGSALYLGWHHPSNALPAWSALTLGRPADLEQDALMEWVAGQGAALQGCEAALLWPSTLHACMDVLDVVARDHTLIASRNLYPIMGWALERQIGRGGRVHFAAPQEDLAQAVLRCPTGQRPALLVPAHDSQGQPIDWRTVLQVLTARDGLLITDHTQLLGLFGEPGLVPVASTCRFGDFGCGGDGDWGSGGGGWLRHTLPLQPDLARRVVLIASWAKSFGAPLASVAGAAEWITALQMHGASRVHSSPVNRVALLAAQHALRLNSCWGDRVRTKLRHNIRLLSHYLRHSGLGVMNVVGTNALHPMLRLGGMSAAQARHAQARLLQVGVRCVAVPAQPAGAGALVWLARADHGTQDFLQLRRALLRFQPLRKVAS